MIIPKMVEFFETLQEDQRDKFSADRLSGKHYVYLKMYPDGTVFYVGKGTGNRIDQHEIEARQGIQSYKCNVIRKIWAEGGQVLSQKVAYFDNEEDAFELEKLLIAFFGRKNLTNLTNGGDGAGVGNTHAKSKYGRTRLVVHFSIGNPPSNPRLERICKHLKKQGIEPTDQKIADIVKEGFYRYLDEAFKEE